MIKFEYSLMELMLFYNSCPDLPGQMHVAFVQYPSEQSMEVHIVYTITTRYGEKVRRDNLAALYNCINVNTPVHETLEGYSVLMESAMSMYERKLAQDFLD